MITRNRQELSLELQTEIQNRIKEIELLRKDTDIELVKINENIDTVSASMDERIAVQVINTKTVRQEHTGDKSEIYDTDQGNK
jgi:hypothetical protein